MSSRVISIRLNSEVLAQCLMLLQKHNMKVEGMPVSRAVKIVVETIILQQERNGTLEPLDAMTADTFLENHLDTSATTPEVSSSFGDTLRSVAEASNHEATEVHPIINRSEMVVEGERLARQLHEKRTPQVTKQLDIKEPNMDEIEVGTGEFWNVPYMPLADIIETSPKDAVIESFLTQKSRGKGDPRMVDLMQRCIEIVYKQTEVEKWGTPAVHRQVDNLFQQNM